MRHGTAHPTNSTPGYFGGLYVEYTPAYRVQVLAEPGHGSDVNAAVQAFSDLNDLQGLINVEETVYTESFLLDEADQVRALIPEAEALDIDIEEGKVLVWVADPAERDPVRSRFPSSSPAIPDNVQVEVGEVFSTRQLTGGTSMYPSGCTVAFNLQEIGNPSKERGLTAGHCVDVGDVEYVNATADHVEAEDSLFQENWDMATLKPWDSPNLTFPNKIQVGTDPDEYRRITARKSRAQMYKNEVVCMFGWVSQEGSCGIIRSKHFNPGDPPNQYYPEEGNWRPTFIRVAGLPYLTVCQGGDSGAPWFQKQTAYGVQSGHIGGQAGSGSNVCFFTAQNYTQGFGYKVKVSP